MAITSRAPRVPLFVPGCASGSGVVQHAEVVPAACSPRNRSKHNDESLCRVVRVDLPIRQTEEERRREESDRGAR